MSVIVSNENKNLLVCKGAIEEVLLLCAFADDNGAAPRGVVPLTDEMRQKVRQITHDLNEDGLRALAIAFKWLPPEGRTYTVGDEQDLVLAGYVAFLDPPKETARESIAALRDYGVAVKVITGDNEIVTRRVCNEVGLTADNALLGKDVAGLTDADLADAAERTTIFTKMSPLDKSRVIRALQSKGHTVGYLGDGINDDAALKDADVGISVDTAVDILLRSRLASFIYRLPILAFHTAHDRSCCRSRESARLREQPAR
jgi:P-type Mg2+ transporter